MDFICWEECIRDTQFILRRVSVVKIAYSYAVWLYIIRYLSKLNVLLLLEICFITS
jgi:hypothetical protein